MLDYAPNRVARERARRAQRVEVASIVRRLDWVLLATVAALVGYGLWAIAGITKHDVDGAPDYFVKRQSIFLALGTVGLLAALAVDPAQLRRLYRPFFGVTVGLLLVVFLMGSLVRGSRRWIDLGPFQFQPSELGKVLIVVFLAGFLAERGKRVRELNTVLTAVGLGLVPTVLVFLQPDFGTSLVYVAATAAALFFAGARWLHLAVLGTLATGAAIALLWGLPAAGVEVLKPYQAARLTAFADPGSDPRSATYQINQSILAVGAGGLEGRGVDGATQTSLDYLPEHETDFVFASLAEQRGFLGASILLGLYLLLLWRGLRIIPSVRDSFSAIVAGSIVFALLFQIFVNVGMTMGIAPITGIPLPFVSVGGSSLIANLLAMGVLLSIGARSRARG